MGINGMVSSATEGRTLLIASTGGHLEQLLRLKGRLEPAPGVIEWATFDDPQSRSLLAGETVHHVDYVAPRHLSTVVRNVPEAARILREGNFARIVTTGSAIVGSFLPIARAKGISCHFIESAARAQGPSVTGNLISRIPGMHLYAQYESWANDKWLYRGSLFDSYRPEPTAGPAGGLANRVVVTFGTMRTYDFRRAAEALVKVLPEVTAPDVEILWQVGVTDTSGLGIEAHESVPASEIRRAITDADLVIAHAGVGSALTTLDLGKAPVLLPRLKIHREMVDDHQLMIAGELHGRGLAVSRDPDALTPEDLLRAMQTSVRTEENVAPFRLVE
jgi:UDP-N-acetylglucosamine--N-acetylmuramyl-(pentapeptide) pyrophosphoryl-undecaprenol N-acetylglucosamine transferase